jgi:hypothetical protein
MSHKSETRGNSKRVLKQQFQNALHMSTIQGDAEDKSVRKRVTICGLIARYAVTSSARCSTMIPFNAHTFQNLRDTLYKHKMKKRKEKEN